MSEQKRQTEQKHLSGPLKPSQSIQSILKGTSSRLKTEVPSPDKEQRKKTGRPRQSQKHLDFQIIVFDKPARHGYYSRTMGLFVANTLTHIMLGAVNIVVLRYAVKSNDTHAFVCTFSYHFLCVEAILSLHRVNLWSAPMYSRHRKKTHVFLQLCVVFFSIMGSLPMANGKKTAQGLTFHSITGFTALLILLVAACTAGYIYVFSRKLLKIIHISVALPTFVLSSLCLISGLLKPAFKKDVDTWMPSILVSFVVFYTSVTFGIIFSKLLDRIHRTLN